MHFNPHPHDDSIRRTAPLRHHRSLGRWALLLALVATTLPVAAQDDAPAPAVAIPEGHVGLVADRSSLARRGLKTAGGVIDAGYRGELAVVVRNLAPEAIELAPGDRIAQLLIIPIATPAPVEVESLGETARGTGGFGSTGR